MTKEDNNLDIQNIMFNYMNDVMDECEKKDQISSTIDSGYCLSTGLLTLDIVMNGGIRSGWTTSVGLEQSGKTSLAIKMLGSLAKENIPGYFIDAEGSLNTEYTCAIAGIEDVEEYFGRKSPTGKGYEVLPKIRYTSENGMEKVFKFMHRILLRLPDKLYRQENKKWYYVFDKSKEDQALMKQLGLKHDAKLYTQTGRYWCESPDGKFQVVFILDSLPGLEPEASGEDADGASNAMAFKARALSKSASPIRGLLRRKHAVFLPVNQLRQAPGVMFGCFAYNSLVTTDQGRIPIGEIVQKKLKVNVLSYNFNSKVFEFKPVIDWYNNGEFEANPMLIQVQVGGKSSYSGIRCTPNHKLFEFEKDFKEAKDFKIGEYLTTYKNIYEFKEDSKQVLFGLLLGDGYLKTKRGISYSIGCTHQIKQGEYNIQKFNTLGIPYKFEKSLEKYVKIKTESFNFIKDYEYFNQYTSIKKCRVFSGVPDEILNELDLRGIAIWYQDDGTYGWASSGKKNNYKKKEFFYISAPRLRFNQNAVEKLLNILKNLGFNFSYEKGSFILKNKEEMHNFLKTLAPYIHPQLAYKVPEEFRNLCGTYLWKPSVELHKNIAYPAKIVEIQTQAKDFATKYGVRKYKYDIEIADNHNYLVGDCLVHNSPEYEPCGNFVKFASDVRNELASRSVPDWFEPGVIPETGSTTKQYGEEDSVEGKGKDRYMYKMIKNIKNKNGIPFRRGWVRIWTSDCNGKCRGFDSVFDTLKYLESTKQITLTKTAGRREIKGLEKFIPQLGEKSIVQWLDFKRYVLGKETNNDKLLEEFIANTGIKCTIEDLPNIRQQCFEQIRSGQAFDLMLVKEINVNDNNNDIEDFESSAEDFNDDFE